MGQGLISKDLIRQIKDRTDIADVVSGYVGLTKAGQNMKGLCPFHAEKTPSFTVSPSRQVFHCFGCGVGGDVFAFLMKRENLAFMDAVRELGRRAGVEVVREAGQPASDQEQRRERIWRANEAAAAWFTGNLQDQQLGADARHYLAARGIRAETVETFGLGYAPPSWDGLVRALTREGFGLAELAAAGLVVDKDEPGSRRQDERRYYDRFRARVMFPIVDQRGRVMAFGGRVIGEGLPKYLNSPELPTFKKGAALYAMPQAKDAAWRAKSLIIVEGYFDAVALHQAGIRHAVATLGTALTPDHVRTLSRLVGKVVLIFDPDPAGVRAAMRTLDLFKDSGMSVRVVSLPAGRDPDTFIREHGAEEFRRLESSAPGLLEFAVAQSLSAATSGALDDRIRSVEEVLRILHKTNNPVEQEECFRLVAEQLGMSHGVLLKRYKEIASNASTLPQGTARPVAKAVTVSGRAEERELVRLLLHDRLAPAHLGLLRSEHFSVPACRRLVEAALAHLDETGRVIVRDVLNEIINDPEAGPLATELSLSEVHDDDEEAHIRGCLETLLRKQRESRMNELIARLRTAEREGRIEDARQLNAQVNALRMEKAIGASRAL